MKLAIYLLLLGLALAPVISNAQISIPSDGSDGALNVSSSVQIDLSQAVTGTWSDNNTANTGKGIFDPSRRAIVFKYSSINITSGRTVTFKNHPSRAPVVWLVQGDAIIAGTINLSGASTAGGNTPAEPGPGGFRGGATGSLGAGSGLGVGGGVVSPNPGLFASVYGNPSLVPLMGGSGGFSGGAGGGAIFIAAAGTIQVSGTINSLGGGTGGSSQGSGSGGGVRLVAHALSGSGTINTGNDGRIRLEANSTSGSLVTLPQTIAVPPATPPVIWPGNDAPTVKVVAVDAVAAPAVPTAPLDLAADIGISTSGATTVTLQTTNFPTTGLVEVRSAPKFGSAAVWTTAVFQSGDASAATWTATVNFPTGFTTLQARATVP
jgi:plastocyanin